MFLISAITDVNIPISLPLKNKYTLNTSTVGEQNLLFKAFNFTFEQKIIGSSLRLYRKTPILWPIPMLFADTSWHPVQTSEIVQHFRAYLFT